MLQTLSLNRDQIESFKAKGSQGVSGESPPVVLQSVNLGRGEILIAREDLLPGGTKQRAVTPFLEELKKSGVNSVVYASPFCGFAQVALAMSGRPLGLSVDLFCEKDTTQLGTPKAHEFSRLAQESGATIHLCNSLAEAETRAEDFAARQNSCFKVPLGFREPRYLQFMKERVAQEFRRIAIAIGAVPSRVWLPVGSATLANVFCEITDARTQLICVDVGVLTAGDPRLESLASHPKVKMQRAKEKFHEPSQTQPPIPSNIHYDAKLWTAILKEGQAGDLWWNVAR